MVMFLLINCHLSCYLLLSLYFITDLPYVYLISDAIIVLCAVLYGTGMNLFIVVYYIGYK